ncbi:MAG: thiamine pyrophosphate-binding protein [Nitriliruptorales bacterium]|nr:thiamine pyrophosphate-binding protein [Nitriliruptorales bacterium]
MQQALDAPSGRIEEPVGLPSISPGGYVSDLIVDVLRASGCRYVPLNPGSSFRGLHDSLVNHAGNRDPQLLLCMHEEIAVSLAHGYAKASGDVAVAAIHDLVGLMHASMAVYDAWCDRTPLLLLGGGGPAATNARRPIDWLHSAAVQAQLVRDYVKWDDEPADAQGLLDSVARGYQLAGTPPRGPVYVTLDADLQERPASGDAAVPDKRLRHPAAGPGAHPEALMAAARLLVAARLPVVVGGRVGLDPRATGALVGLVELLGAAYRDDRNVVAFPTDHPANLTGDRALLTEADAVLAVDLPDLRTVRGMPSSRDRARDGTRARPATLAAVTLDPLTPSSWSHAGQAPVPVDVPLLAEPITAVTQLHAAVEDLLSAEPRDARERRTRRVEELSARRDQLRARQQAAVSAAWNQVPIAPARLVAEVWEAVRDRPWLLTLRNTRSWPEGVWQFPGAGSYLGHSGGAGVGYGPGAAVGGALAARDRAQLGVAIIGDGDLLMAPGALWTATHYQIPLLMIVNNNRSFYNDEEHQHVVAQQRGRPEANAWIGMRLEHPAVDLATLARSFGAWAAGPVTHPDALAGALAGALRAVDDGQVALVDVHTAPA